MNEGQRLIPLYSMTEGDQLSAQNVVETEYRGLKIIPPSNLHKECFSLIETLNLPKAATALDLGAGEGAFSQRLIDNCFRVTAVEFETGRYVVEAPCHQMDLNADFSHKFNEKFDLIVAIEIIKHLHDPRHFIKNCLDLLKDQGYLLVTSPNAESWVSRIRSLSDGRFLWFDVVDYDSVGRLTPIFSWQMAQICREFNVSLKQALHTESRLLWQSLGESLLEILKAFLMGALYPFMKGRKDREVNIYLISRNLP